MGDRLATVDMDQKLGAVPHCGGELGPHPSNNVAWAEAFLPSDILIYRAVWPQQTWAENSGLCPFGGGGAESTSNTMWPGPKPTSMPSFILIHLAV